VWVVLIRWDHGDSDNKRSASGEVMWEHSGPRGWTVDLGGSYATKVTEEWGQPVAPGIYVHLVAGQQPFPAGTVDVENGHLFFREDAG
jgi:hypothetical protein